MQPQKLIKQNFKVKKRNRQSHNFIEDFAYFSQQLIEKTDIEKPKLKNCMQQFQSMYSFQAYAENFQKLCIDHKDSLRIFQD